MKHFLFRLKTFWLFIFTRWWLHDCFVIIFFMIVFIYILFMDRFVQAWIYLRWYCPPLSWSRGPSSTNWVITTTTRTSSQSMLVNRTYQLLVTRCKNSSDFDYDKTLALLPMVHCIDCYFSVKAKYMQCMLSYTCTHWVSLQRLLLSLSGLFC